MKEYNKLVRDFVPAIITAAGKGVETRIADQSEYRELLNLKLLEEVQEFLDSQSSEEIADILEVLMAIAANHNLRWEDIEQLAEQKRQERGAFEKRIVLLRAEP